MTKTQRDNHKRIGLRRAAKRRRQRHYDSIKHRATTFSELPSIVAGASILDESYHGFRQPPVRPARPQFNVLQVNA